jgi:hypothetical protein
MFASIALMILSVFACSFLSVLLNRNVIYAFVMDANTFLALSTGVFSFLFFKNIKVKYNKFINYFAASTFGVLLLHSHSDYFRKWLWIDVLDTIETYNSPYLLIHSFGSVLAIFVVCTIIDSLRIRFVEKPFFSFADKYIDKIISSYKIIEEKVFKRLKIGQQ